MALGGALALGGGVMALGGARRGVVISVRLFGGGNKRSSRRRVIGGSSRGVGVNKQ